MILIKSIDKFKKIYFLPILLFHLILLINTKFTLWPEMVVYPYLLNNGFVLYKDLINPYLPTLTYILSIFTKLFGFSPENFRALTWIYIILVDILIFKISLLLSKNYFKSTLSLLFFVFISMPLFVNGLWFDLIQTPFVILSIYNFYQFTHTNTRKSVQLTFIFVLIAVFIKQQAVWLMIFYVAALTFSFRPKRTYWLKAIIPVIILFATIYFCFAILFTRQHVLKEFFFWTTYFPFIRSSSLPGYVLLPTIKQFILILFLFAPFIPVVFSNLKYKVFILGSLSVTLFAYPRFDYFHLITSLSIISLVAGEVFFFKMKNKKVVIMCLLSSFVVLGIFSFKYFKSNWTQEIRFFETDIQTSATFLSLITNPDDRIYMQNAPDQLYPLSKRLPPKPWVDEFPWYLELEGYQQQVVDGIDSSKTKFVVFKPYEIKKEFDLGTYKSALITGYINANYHDYVKISDSLWLKVKN